MAEASSASSLASKIDKDFLECSICCGPFNDPRALPCLHPFCCGCLEDWAKTCSEDGKILSCPLCKKVYQVPGEGIKDFPAHFLVANLQNTVDTAKQVWRFSYHFYIQQEEDPHSGCRFKNESKMEWFGAAFNTFTWVCVEYVRKESILHLFTFPKKKFMGYFA